MIGPLTPTDTGRWAWKALVPRLLRPNPDVFVLGHELGATAAAVRVFIDCYWSVIAGELRLEDESPGLRAHYDGDDLTPDDVVVYLNVVYRIAELQAGRAADLPQITTQRSPDTPRSWDVGPLYCLRVESR